MKKTKSMSSVKKVALVGAAAAVGAGAYYLLGPKAKAHQKKAKVLMAKIKKEVDKDIKKAKEVSVPLYHKTVDAISEKYTKEYKAHEKDIKAFSKKLKDELKKLK